jgi:hypothetical protein
VDKIISENVSDALENVHGDSDSCGKDNVEMEIGNGYYICAR